MLKYVLTSDISILPSPFYFCFHAMKYEIRIRKDVVQELYHEFQFEGNPWAPHKAEEAAAKICMAQLLANIGSLGYKLYVSLDVHKSSKDSESECLVFRRVGRVWR